MTEESARPAAPPAAPPDASAPAPEGPASKPGPDQTGSLGALVTLAIGGGLAAALDFAGIAGQGFRAGQLILALAPWILAWRGRKPGAGGRPLEGSVDVGWVLLLAGALAAVIPGRADGALTAGAAAVQAAGAAAVLVVLHRARHFGTLGLFVRLSVGAVVGAALAAAASRPVGLVVAIGVSNVFVAAHLVPQLVHDFTVFMWGRRTGAWDRVKVSLQGVGAPFILWTLAGHLVIAPAILYFSPKPEVFLRGLGTAVCLALFAIRGFAGVFSKRGAIGVVAVATLYGVGLAILVTGGRPY